MQLEQWQNEAAARWPKRINEIRAIVDLCEDTAYRQDYKILKRERFSALEFDLGLAMIWRRGPNIEKFFYHSDSNQIFDLNRRSTNDRMPRGSAEIISNAIDMVEGMIMDQPNKVQRAIAEMTDHRRENNFSNMRKSVAKQSEKKKRKVRR